MLRVSIVVPTFNSAQTIAECLQAIGSQSLPRDQYEVILVDNGSRDATTTIADQFDAKQLLQNTRGAAQARNVGWAAARGEWIAFTDSDCIPSRMWLQSLLDRAATDRMAAHPIGVAGRTLGYRSTSAAARYVDLTGGLDAETYLAHPAFPWAPTNNVMYLRSALETVEGFDARYVTYEGGDLSYRLQTVFNHALVFEPRAVVLHQHRSTWRAYWRQQYGYGRGYGQFIWKHRDHFRWT
ncbi:MAG TPA: glycosyltransferase, partial [Anaerolineae bacterium]|nr:glycosyltransferase [Anaerolineae bacterium]